MKNLFLVFLFGAILITPVYSFEFLGANDEVSDDVGIREGNSNVTRINLYTTKIGNRQHKFTLDLAKISEHPLVYRFDIVSYEMSYKYGGKIKWKREKKFPHGEGFIGDISGTDRMNITGWLGKDTAENRYFGLMSRVDLAGDKYWIVAKEINNKHVAYGRYYVNTTY